ncbi:MAG: hypothetical protein IIA30_15130 [Myxococcales bacterium]|nr:hypothetical protein [Myxococcales bacterium]
MESPASAEAAVRVADDEPQLLCLMQRLCAKRFRRRLISRRWKTRS